LKDNSFPGEVFGRDATFSGKSGSLDKSSDPKMVGEKA